MLLPRPLHHKHVLHHKTPPQSVLAAPQISSLASARSRYHPQTPAEQCPVPRSYHITDCGTDHSMVASRVGLHLKRIHRSKQKGRPRINTAMTFVPELRERFADAIQEALSDCPTSCADERWNHIRDATYKSTVDTFGERERKSPDRIEAGIDELEPAILSKRTALLNYKLDPSEKTLAALRWARSVTQRIARQCANNYWQSIQMSADCGNIRTMYEGMMKRLPLSKQLPAKSSQTVQSKWRDGQSITRSCTRGRPSCLTQQRRTRAPCQSWKSFMTHPLLRSSVRP